MWTAKFRLNTEISALTILRIMERATVFSFHCRESLTCSVLNIIRADEIMEAFNLIDIDQGGEISLEELRDAMKSADVGITKPEMEYMFRKVTNFTYC